MTPALDSRPKRTIYKKLGEKWSPAFEFLNKLPPGATIVSGVVVALKVSDGSDVTGATLVSGSLVIAGTQAKFTFSDTCPVGRYRIKGTVTLSDAGILIEVVDLDVVNAT